MRLPTAGGHITITEHHGASHCDGCDRSGGGMAWVDVTVDDPSEGLPGRIQLVLCGTCIATGLAIQMGRAHVQQGGQVTDLKIEGTAPCHEITATEIPEGADRMTDAAVCGRTWTKPGLRGFYRCVRPAGHEDVHRSSTGETAWAAGDPRPS